MGENDPVQQPHRPVITIIGPTASGKSDLSLHLARLLDGEVVNADSMQLYRGMDIGTAKLPPHARGGVAHHLLDIWDVRETANVADFQQRARAVVADIRARGRLPIVVGGSGLYVRALLDDLRFPGTDDAVRARLQTELDDVGPAVLHRRLTEVDPIAAAAILPSNGRRIVRALEVIELTGGEFTATLPQPAPVIDSLTVGLAIPRDVLDARIAERVEVMWRAGLVAEVQALREVGLEEGLTARKALGYAQILDALAAGRNPDTAIEPTVAATRRFARRQWSWFERDRGVHWLDWDRPDLATHIRTLWSEHAAAATP